MEQQIITIDIRGPAGSGKTTISEVIAETLRGIDVEGSGGRLEPFHVISDHGELPQEWIKRAAAGHSRVVVLRDYEAGCSASSEPTHAHQCCGKCEKPDEEVIDWRERYMRKVEGLNNEGDPIGGEPAMGLRQVVDRQRFALDDLAQRLQAADMVINVLVQAAGGEVIVTQEICEKAMDHQIESEISDDGRSTFTFRSVPVPQQVPQ